MKKSIVAIVFSLLFLVSCLNDSLSQPINTSPSTMDISAPRTSDFQTVRAEATAFDTPTETLIHLPTLTPTSTIIPILMYSDVLGENCSTKDGFNANEVDYDLNATLLKMVTQLPPDIITPPPGIDFDSGNFLGYEESYCYFISIPKKSDHRSFDGYAFWNGKGSIIYWTEGVVSGGGDQTIYNFANGGWYWLVFLTLTKEMEVQMLTPEYLQTLSVDMTRTISSTPMPPIIP